MVANTTTITDRTPPGFGPQGEPEPAPNPLAVPMRSSYDKFGTVFDYDQLQEHTPERANIRATTTHAPVPIADLLEKTYHALDSHGFRWGQPLTIARGKPDPTDTSDKPRTLYTDFESRIVVEHDNINPAVGRGSMPAQRLVTLACSYAKRRAAELAFQLIMEVCLNGLCLMDIEARHSRKQTPGLASDGAQYGFIFSGIASGLRQFGYQSDRVKQLESIPFDNDSMKVAAFDLADAGIVNDAAAARIAREYIGAESDEAPPESSAWASRDAWSAVNATTAIQQGHAERRATPFGQARRDARTVEIIEAVAERRTV